MLTLDQAKAYLKLDLAATDEDQLLTVLLAAVLATFKVESKHRWAVEGEPSVSVVTDPTTEPPTTQFVAYVDPAVLSPEQAVIAGQWMRLVLGHWYENRGSVTVGLNVTEVPQTAKWLMNLLREPTL